MKEYLKRYTIRLYPSIIKKIKEIADQKGIPYQTLIRMWLIEKIKKHKTFLRKDL